MKYIKQYGELRTGTNYLKRLVELNFPDVTVFGSILGWKHGTYDLSNTIDNTRSHYEWIEKKTKKGIVYSVDNLPLHKHPPEVLREAVTGIHYLFSIKKPVPFILSYKKFRLPNKLLTDTHIITLCNRYNERYRKWLEMYKLNESRSFFITYESLIRDINHVLLNIELRFGLDKLSPEASYIDETNPVNASTDIGLIIDKKKTFNKAYYLEEKYLDEFSESQLNIIDNNIDQGLLEEIYKVGL